MPCAICYGNELFPYGDEKNGFRFVKCGDCGYVVASPMPTREELNEVYSAGHFRSSYHPEEAVDTGLCAQREVQYVQDRALLLEFVSAGRLLDFGCGNGRFLGGFPRSFEKFGYEFNRTTTEYLHQTAEFQVLDTEEAVRALPARSFDAVTMRGVIEHLVDPEETLAFLADKLGAGGVLFICATPNVDSPCALVYGTDWNQFTPPFHLHFFSPRTLAVMAARHGLALIECRLPYLGTPYEHEAADGARFLRGVTGSNGEEGAVTTKVASPPFPGTMMSLVLRKIE